MGWIDTLMLGAHVGDADVGAYTIALKLAALTSLPLMAVNAIAAPKFAEAHSMGTPHRMVSTVEQSGRLILLTSLPVAAVLWLAPAFWLGLFAPEAVAAVSALTILLAGFLINAIAGSVGPLLNMTGRQKAFRNITFIVVLAKVVINLWLIPTFGIAGAATSSLLAFASWNLMCIVYLRRSLGMWTVPFLAQFSTVSAP
jgi:O-antigen/teichoic acid export membrane protein